MEQALIKSCFQRNDFVCYHSEFETSIQIGEHGRNFNTKSQRVPNPIISSKDWLVRFVFISKCAVGIIKLPSAPRFQVSPSSSARGMRSVSGSSSTHGPERKSAETQQVLHL